jgi:hypothetical protein
MVCTDRERRLEQAILAARNSNLPRYGEYLTPKQPDSYRPRRSWVNKVLRYLQEAGYNPRVDQSGHRVKTDMTVAQASGAGWRGLDASCQRNRAKLWGPHQRPLEPTAVQTVVEVILGLDQTPVRSGLAQQRSQTAVTKMAK